jgi:asparagine synthase (glutamine-hydrolysing)
LAQRQSATHEPLYFYPPWFNSEFEKRLDLRSRWHAFWDWRPPQAHPLHPIVAERLLFPVWHSMLELASPLDFAPPVSALTYLDVRLVNFVLSLPPQPWFRRKYLLRRAMRDSLPTEVLKRPKTLLGTLQRSLLNQPGLEWVDRWQPAPGLGQWVRRDAIPPIVGTDDAQAAYVHLRPLLLNHWLQSIV